MLSWRLRFACYVKLLARTPTREMIMAPAMLAENRAEGMGFMRRAA